MTYDFRLCDEDRANADLCPPGAPEWLTLDIDRLESETAERLMIWEAECGYPIEKAVGEIGRRMNAHATLVCVWLARMQGGYIAGGRLDDGRYEPFLGLKSVRTLKVDIRRTPKADDADPPASSEPSSTDGTSASS